MKSMPGYGDAATWNGRTYDYEDREEEQEDERTDDGAPEFYDIETGEIDA